VPDLDEWAWVCGAQAGIVGMGRIGEAMGDVRALWTPIHYHNRKRGNRRSKRSWKRLLDDLDRMLHRMDIVSIMSLFAGDRIICSLRNWLKRMKPRLI